MKLTEKITARYTWRVWFVPWYLVIVAVGITTITAGSLVSTNVFRLLATICAGSVVGLGSAQAAKLLTEIRTERWHQYMPAQVEMLDSNDEEQTVSVTRGNGENVIVTLPADYHPLQDGGFKLVEAACPNMPKWLRENWKDIAVEIGLRRLMDRDE